MNKSKVKGIINNYDEGWHYLNNSALGDKNVSKSAKLLLYYISSYDFKKRGYIYHSLERIAEYFGVCTRTIQKWAKELAEKGYITKRRKGFADVNIYTLTDKALNREKMKKAKEAIGNFVDSTEKVINTVVQKIKKGEITEKEGAKLINEITKESKPKYNYSNNYTNNKNQKLKFDNFEGRTYDYDSLEKKLLGWE